MIFSSVFVTLTCLWLQLLADVESGKQGALTSILNTEQTQKGSKQIEWLYSGVNAILKGDSQSAKFWKEKLGNKVKKSINDVFLRALLIIFYIDDNNDLVIMSNETFQKKVNHANSSLNATKATFFVPEIYEFIKLFEHTEKEQVAEKVALSLFLKHYFVKYGYGTDNMKDAEVVKFCNDLYDRLFKEILTSDYTVRLRKVFITTRMTNDEKIVKLAVPKLTDMKDEERIDHLVRIINAAKKPERVEDESDYRSKPVSLNEDLITRIQKEDALLQRVKMLGFMGALINYLFIPDAMIEQEKFQKLENEEDRKQFTSVDQNFFRFDLSWESYFALLKGTFDVYYLKDPENPDPKNPGFPKIDINLQPEVPKEGWRVSSFRRGLRTLFQLVGKVTPDGNLGVEEKMAAAIAGTFYMTCLLKSVRINDSNDKEVFRKNTEWLKETLAILRIIFENELEAPRMMVSIKLPPEGKIMPEQSVYARKDLAEVEYSVVNTIRAMKSESLQSELNDVRKIVYKIHTLITKPIKTLTVKINEIRGYASALVTSLDGILDRTYEESPEVRRWLNDALSFAEDVEDKFFCMQTNLEKNIHMRVFEIIHALKPIIPSLKLTAAIDSASWHVYTTKPKDSTHVNICFNADDELPDLRRLPDLKGRVGEIWEIAHITIPSNGKLREEACETIRRETLGAIMEVFDLPLYPVIIDSMRREILRSAFSENLESAKIIKLAHSGTFAKKIVDQANFVGMSVRKREAGRVEPRRERPNEPRGGIQLSRGGAAVPNLLAPNLGPGPTVKHKKSTRRLD